MVNNNFDMTSARWNFAQREKRRERTRFELHANAAIDAERIIESIISRFNPKRIYQWGSLLHPEQFDENSDIDIAVEGLQSIGDFFDCFGMAEAMTKFPLDLVEIEKVHHLYVDLIIKLGKLVYERKE